MSETTEKHKVSKALVYFVLTSVCATWGGAFVAIKYLLDFLTPIQLVQFRYFIASLIFAVILLFNKKHQIPVIVKKHFPLLCLVSFFGVIGYNLSLAYGEIKIAAGTASIITNLSPIFNLVLAAIFLKEKMTSFRIGGLFLSLIGLIVIVQFGSEQEIKFDYYIYILITLLAPFSWAIYTVVNKPLRDKFDTVALTGISIIFGTLPFIFFLNKPAFESLMKLPAYGWASLLFLSVACTILGFSGWIWALGKLPSTEVASFTYLAPIFSVIFGYLFLGERITVGIIAGAFVLLFGVYIANKEPNSNKNFNKDISLNNE